MVVQNVHIDTLSAAVGERPRVVLVLDEAAYASDDHGARENGLNIASRHLKHDAHVGGDGRHKTRPPLNAAAPLVPFGVICRDLKRYVIC